MKGNLNLVHSRKSIDPMGEAADADGFVGIQPYSKVGNDFMHVVATRVPQQNYRHLQKFQRDMLEYLNQFEGWFIDIRSIPKNGREVALVAGVSATVSKDIFESEVVDTFKQALKNAKILQYPLDCPIPSDLRSVSESLE